jgi:sensor histidine kinase YesM
MRIIFLVIAFFYVSEMRVTKLPFIKELPFHILFWIGVLVYTTTTFGGFGEDLLNEFYAQLSFLPIVMAATYFTIYLLIPKLLLKKKYTLFIIAFLVSAVIFALMIRTLNYYFVMPNFFPDLLPYYTILDTGILFTLFWLYSIVTFAAAIMLVIYWYEHQKIEQSLAEDKLEAELKFLKAQIHPHFLFNTLNNLYVLTKKKTDEAPELLLKLSEILRYMLYECESTTVPLKKEINIIEHYIALERLRHGSDLSCTFKKEGESFGLPVAPMLLLPFVENGFKHGVSKMADQKWIHITLLYKDGLLRFVVENSKVPVNGTTVNNADEGIGLKNVRRRLELLYPDVHTLRIFDNTDHYTVVLEIDFRKANERDAL